MVLIDLREPINACSHGAGMLLAIPVTWFLCMRCRNFGADCTEDMRLLRASRYERVKLACLLVFGLSLTSCYGISALFHGVWFSGESLARLQRLDHIGIFFLIAGTYTPVAWSLMRGHWWWVTLATIWTVAGVCAVRVWCGGLMPVWVSTVIYLVMGWSAVFCYFELARFYPHRTLAPLPVGGVFYSVGALFNLAKWPVLVPGVFAAHELFHFFVIAGSACHIFFMLKVVVPAREARNFPERLAGTSVDFASSRGSTWPDWSRLQWRVHVSAAVSASPVQTNDERVGSRDTQHLN
jgi:hemolysin III